MDIVKYEQKHVIIFQDKSRVHMNDSDFKKFMEAMQTRGEGVMLNGNYYRFSSVAKILTQAEFYQQYPQHIPPFKPETKIEHTEKLPEKRLRAGWIRTIRIAMETNPKLDFDGIKKYIGRVINIYGIRKEEI